ncbi:MAG: NAD(+)/NADH kinase [Holophagaceae bacterium]|nr:NAD(+)/NADH kinase [Holophagaceae bacterium]
MSPTVAIIAKAKSPLLPKTLAEIAPCFLGRGWVLVARASLAGPWSEAGLDPAFLRIDENLGDAPELGLVLGGDGTLLSAARRVGIRGAKLLGINLGSLGFLTSHSANDAKTAVEAFLAGELEEDTRKMLHAELWRDDGKVMEAEILNDAVLAKGALARIMDMHLSVNGQEAALIKADGLIVATPTGSTAYSLSAGGPILHPGLEALVISPICPHSLTLRPLVVDAAMRVSITVGDAEDAHLTLDGQIGQAVRQGDRVEVCRSPHTITLLQSPALPYFRLLQQKLHWSDR